MVCRRRLTWLAVALVMGLGTWSNAESTSRESTSLENSRAEELRLQLPANVRSLLKDRCVKCHGPAKQDGQLDLSTAVALSLGGESGAAVRAGDLDGSLLWQKISSAEMPPDEPLTKGEQALVRTWILNATSQPTPHAPLEQGLADHWSFRLLQPTVVPQVQHDANCRNDVDRFLQAALEGQGLGLGPQADRATLIRRVSFDLTGLPPTVKELANFLADSTGNAYERMVAGYLSSPRYGERWGKYWLDVAGYADSNGYFASDTERPLAYRYRDYVIRSLNQDKAFDQFIREQLAGDELGGSRAEFEPTAKNIELLEATHFLRNAEDGTADSNGNPNEVLRDRHAVLDATVEILGSALFGLTLQCAKCHDHKFEPVTQRDYYGLQAVLAPAFNVHNWQAPGERYVPAATRQEQAAFEAALKRGQAVEADRPRIAAVRDLSAVAPEVFISLRGDFLTPGEKVAPAGLSMLSTAALDFSKLAPPPGGHSTGYRLAFAQWLTQTGSRPAALLARLQVNRIWQQHFGVGLVNTPANLGLSGEPPSHPELLEWLAAEFIASGWSSKAIHRLIVESAAYRQSNALQEQAYQIDPDNRWLWRMPLQRLDAEAIYDAMLAVSGELDFQLGGPATKTVPVDGGEVAVVENLPGGKRRAVYLQQRRSAIPTMLRAFDAPALVTNCVQRPPSTIPLQSLTLLNSEFTRKRAESFAKRVAQEAGQENEQRIVHSFLLALSREPDAEELRASLQFLRAQTQQYVAVSAVPQRQAWIDFCHTLMINNAFLYIE